jgi:HlyD family secretion protein
MFRKLPFIILGLAIIGLAAAGIYYYVLPTTASGVSIEIQPVTLEVRGPALLDATNKVTVTARVQGFMKTVNVDRNDTVSENQILAEIRSEDVSGQLLAAQADARGAELSIAEAQASADSLKAMGDRAKTDYERKRSLLPSGSITQADWTSAEAVYKQSQADLARAAVSIDRAIAHKASADANVDSLRARLDDATIRSPLNGVVVQRYRNVGDLLTPGVVLMDIVDPRTVILSARFDESVMGSIRPGQRVVARFTAEPDRQFRGSVWRLIRQVDTETREFEVDVVLDELPTIWAIGQRATVTIEVVSPTIAIGQDMLARRNGRAGVWKVTDSRAEWVPVDLGYPSGRLVQVVSGLTAGDLIVTPKSRLYFEPLRVVRRSAALAR